MSAMKLAVSFFALAGLGYGQQIRSEIPFAFQAANTAFQPGIYVVDINIGARWIVLTHQKSQRQAAVLSITESRDVWALDGLKYSVAFRKYGNEYFLAKAVCGGVAGSVVPSRTEKEIMANPPAIQAGRGPVTVTIAARLVK